MRLHIKIIDPRLKGWGFPYYGSRLAAGMDLFACIDNPIEIEPSAPPLLISAGFAMDLSSHGVFALIVPRSGRAQHQGLVLGNTVGVIDGDYTGPCMVSLWNRRPSTTDQNSSIIIRPGDRIAQLLFLTSIRPEIELTDEFVAQTERGSGGFGSTGDDPQDRS